jgi:hypothetical protein
MKKYLCLLVPLAGCAATSGIRPIGPDTFALSEMRAPAAGGGPAARAAVLADGAAFCQRNGRSFVLLEARPDGDPFTPYWPTAFDATFRCEGK